MHAYIQKKEVGEEYSVIFFLPISLLCLLNTLYKKHECGSGVERPQHRPSDLFVDNTRQTIRVFPGFTEAWDNSFESVCSSRRAKVTRCDSSRIHRAAAEEVTRTSTLFWSIMSVMTMLITIC